MYCVEACLVWPSPMDSCLKRPLGTKLHDEGFGSAKLRPLSDLRSHDSMQIWMDQEPVMIHWYSLHLSGAMIAEIFRMNLHFGNSPILSNLLNLCFNKTKFNMISSRQPVQERSPNLQIDLGLSRNVLRSFNRFPRDSLLESWRWCWEERHEGVFWSKKTLRVPTT